jgi:hypothetical protein
MDFIFCLAERMLYVDFHEDAKELRKNTVLSTVVLSLQNRRLKKERKVFDVVPYAMLDLLFYPSLNC